MKVALAECPAAALAATIAYMYGIDVPEGFAGLPELLRLADMLMMEELRGEVLGRLALQVSLGNYRCRLSSQVFVSSF